MSVRAFSHWMNTGLFTGKEPLTKQKKIFPLELRAKTKGHSDSEETSVKQEEMSEDGGLIEEHLAIQTIGEKELGGVYGTGQAYILLNRKLLSAEVWVSAGKG